MDYYLKDERGYQINQPRLYPKLGLKPGGHLPKEGFEPRVVDGVQFKCEPSSGLGNQSPHRVKYLCEACQLWIPYGRAVQHETGVAHKDNAAHHNQPADFNSNPECD